MSATYTAADAQEMLASFAAFAESIDATERAQWPDTNDPLRYRDEVVDHAIRLAGALVERLAQTLPPSDADKLVDEASDRLLLAVALYVERCQQAGS